jgi:hypothetical protein
VSDGSERGEALSATTIALVAGCIAGLLAAFAVGLVCWRRNQSTQRVHIVGVTPTTAAGGATASGQAQGWEHYGALNVMGASSKSHFGRSTSETNLSFAGLVGRPGHHDTHIHEGDDSETVSAAFATGQAERFGGATHVGALRGWKPYADSLTENVYAGIDQETGPDGSGQDRSSALSAESIEATTGRAAVSLSPSWDDSVYRHVQSRA